MNNDRFDDFDFKIINDKINELKNNQIENYNDEKLLTRMSRTICRGIFPFLIKLYFSAPKNYKLFPIATTSDFFQFYKKNTLKKQIQKLNKTTCIMEHYQDDTIYIPTRNLSRYIDKLKSIGILINIDDFYSFNNFYATSKQYLIDKLELKKVIDSIIRQEHLIYGTAIINNPIIIVDETKNNNKDKINKLYNKKNKSKYDILALQLVEIINKNLNKINDSLPELEQYRMMKGRLYSPICNLQNKEKHPNTIEYTRQDYLDEKYGAGNWIEFDRKSSIFNLLYSIVTGKYNNNDYDFYTFLNGNKEFKNKETRNSFKLFCMYVLFSTTNGIKTKYNKLLDTAIVDKHNDKTTNKKIKDFFIDIFNLTDYLSNQDIDVLQSMIGRYKELKNRFNQVYGKEKIKEIKDSIFIFESAVYLDFVTKLRKENIEVVQVYDGFYLKKDIVEIEYLQKLLKNTILEFVDFVNKEVEKIKI